MSGQGNRDITGLRCNFNQIVYQFYGTESIMSKTFEDPIMSGRWLPLGNWVAVKPRIKDSSIVFESKSLLSSVRSDTQTPPRWFYNANPYLSIQDEGDRPLKIKPVHQPDGMGVKKWQTIENPGLWLISCWAELSPYHAVAARSGAASWFTTMGTTDQGYDIAPHLFKYNKGQKRSPDSDWYRGACLYTTTSEKYGTRVFVIMVDIDHHFYCYPANVAETSFSIKADSDCLDSIFVKKQTPTLPDWVTRFDVGYYSSLSPEDHNAEIQPLWTFSPNGDKAAAVMFHLDEAWKDTHHTSTRYIYKDGTTTANEVREARPGVVELEFFVGVTGDNPENFTFSLAVKQSLYSGDDGRGYIAVGYASQNFNGLPAAVSYNDLLILEHFYYLGELFSQASLYELPDAPLANTDLKVLLHPPIAVVGKVTYNTTPVMQWLSSYTVFSSNSFKNYGGIEPSTLMSPTFDDLTDRPATAANTQTFCLQTHVNAMDIPTLTFCFGVSATLTGICTSGGYFLASSGEFIQWGGPFCASAAYVVTYSLGVKDEERFVGHSQLKSVLPSYFNLSHTHPNLVSMTQVNLNATVNSTAINPTTSQLEDLYKTIHYRTPPVWEFAYGDTNDVYRYTEFADLTINTGFDSSITESVIQSSSLIRSYSTNFVDQLGFNLLNSTEFSTDSWITTTPRIFLMFDGQYYERPGLRWVRKIQVSSIWRPNGYPGTITLEPGDSSFYDYPMGLILHTRFTQNAIFSLNNGYTALNAEPNGSYALFFGPFAAANSTVATHPNINQPVPQLTATFDIEQNFMDIIKVRLPQNGAYLEGKTSHLAQMNQAFGLSLSYNDYAMDFYIGSGQLRIRQRSDMPDRIDDWDVHSRFDRNYMSHDGQQYAGSIVLAPINVGWLKTTYITTVDDYLMQTVPCFHTTDLLTCPSDWVVAFPTPRMEGIFTQLPLARIG